MKILCLVVIIGAVVQFETANDDMTHQAIEKKLVMDSSFDLMSIRDLSMSQLPNPVKDLVCLIFDIGGMKRTMIEFEIDLNKMPLEKLSKDRIMRGYEVLTEMQTALDSGDITDQTRINDAKNRFYQIIPHGFGMQQPLQLNNTEFIKTKTDMLDTLLEIESTYSMLKDTSSNSDRDPIDYNYSKLKTQIDVLNNSSDEFSVISKYVTNTYSKMDFIYKLQVTHVFKIARQGEQKRYKQFKQTPNRQLLWHGSGVSNFAGILSKGLRIAPPEAPKTGYVFGKGIYFADMITKSLEYCKIRGPNSTALLLLSEVALGEMYELTRYNSKITLPKRKQSLRGLGRVHPDPNNFFRRPDGVKVPYGPGVTSHFERSELWFNEYVVYDEAQVNQQYLVQVAVLEY